MALIKDGILWTSLGFCFSSAGRRVVKVCIIDTARFNISLVSLPVPELLEPVRISRSRNLGDIEFHSCVIISWSSLNLGESSRTVLRTARPVNLEVSSFEFSNF